MSRLSPRSFACALAALLFAASGATARAQPSSVDDETRATARIIAQEGLDFYDKGRFKEALEKLEKANALVSAPTLGLMLARCNEKLGRLVEASERYLDVSRTQLDSKASELFRKAVADAAHERAALIPLIPSVTITLEGGDPERARVSIDGKPIPPAMLGVKRLINPGTHTIEAEEGALRASESVTLKPRDATEVTLTLAPPEGGGSAPARGSSAGGAGAQKVLGFVAMGVGGAGVVTGIITGAIAAGKLSDLEDRGCVNGHCTKSQRSAVDEYNTLRVVSSVGLFAGAGVAAGGLILVLTAPKSKPDPKRHHDAEAAFVRPFVGVGSAGVLGTF